MKILHKVAGRLSDKLSKRTENASKSGKILYTSSTISGQDPGSAEEIRFGQAHYSYKLAKSKFESMFNKYNYRLYDVNRPEIYNSKVSISSLPIPVEGSTHLIFKPFEHIRLLKRSRNIACLAWEFSRIQTQSFVNRKLLPMEDYRIVAKSLDEIWTPCTYARDVMIDHGITNVRFIPAPIDTKSKGNGHKTFEMPNIVLLPLIMNGWLFDFRKHESNIAMHYDDIINKFYDGKRPKVYIMVFNPGDMRKNPGAAIRAFIEFNAIHPETLLIIKFVWNHAFGNIYDVIDTHFRARMGEIKYLNTKSIWLTDETFPKHVFESIVGASDFYVCTSFCEGQNLPLLEAMAAGVVPISVDHTAMADYVSQANSVVVPSYRTRDEISLSVAKDIVGAEWYAIDDDDLVASFKLSYKLSKVEYRSKSTSASNTVLEKYSPEAVRGLIGNL